MLDPDLLDRAVSLTALAVVVLLTIPSLVYVCRTSARFGRGYVQLSGDEDIYHDRDGIATEDSIRAFSDTRPKIAIWLGAAIGLGASVATRVMVLRGTEHVNVLSELTALTESVCWVGRPIIPDDGE